MSPLKISISGVRGTIKDDLSLDFCRDFAQAFAAYLNHQGTVLIGHDGRVSGKEIQSAVIEGLNLGGINVIDLGLAPTPTIGVLIPHLKAQGAVIITASHNPIEWNGLKFVRSDGLFLNQTQAEKLIGIFERKNFSPAPKKGTYQKYASANQDHINKILPHVEVEKIKARKYKVVLDSINASGSIIGPMLLEKLGCQVIKIHAELNRDFERGAEPIAKNLARLCESVKKEKADIGFALDPDADRLAIVSEKGEAIGEEYTLALAIKYFFQFRKPTSRLTVINLSTSRMIDDLGKELDFKVMRTKIGEINVAEKIKELNAPIGGEGNGGVIFPAVGYNRDSLSAMAIILNLMSQTQITISRLKESLPAYAMVKDKIECTDPKEAEKIIQKAKEIFKGYEQNNLDGIKVILKNSWLHIRSSNTEPIVRLMAEAPTQEEAEKLIAQCKNQAI